MKSRYEINPRFRAMLPAIQESIAEALETGEPMLEEVRVRIAELHDYLDFEIEKARLALDKLEWEVRVDPEEKQETTLWLVRLVELKSTYPADGILASITFLANLRAALDQTFSEPAEAPQT